MHIELELEHDKLEEELLDVCWEYDPQTLPAASMIKKIQVLIDRLEEVQEAIASVKVTRALNPKP